MVFDLKVAHDLAVVLTRAVADWVFFLLVWRRALHRIVRRVVRTQIKICRLKRFRRLGFDPLLPQEIPTQATRL